MQKIFNIDLEMDPLSLILGLPSGNVTTVANKRLYNLLTFAARKNILLQWISDKSPSIKGWSQIVFELIPLEHLTCILHTKIDQFYQIWQVATLSQLHNFISLYEILHIAIIWLLKSF